MSVENDTVQVVNNAALKNEVIAQAREERALRIKALRESSGLSLEEFAVMAGVTRKTQFQYEKGNTSPDADYLDRLFFERAVDVGELVTGVPRALRTGYDAQTRSVADRFQTLPPKLRKTVDDVLLLVWLAYQDRRAVHDEVDGPAPAKPTAGKKKAA